MRSATNPRNCLHCKSIFFADRRNLRHQKFCHQLACQAVSKRQAQHRWLSKDDNRDYFKGSAAVERVRAWRARNPGYWKRPKKRPQSALQDLSTTQPPVNKPQTSVKPAKSDSKTRKFNSVKVTINGGARRRGFQTVFPPLNPGGL